MTARALFVFASCLPWIVTGCAKKARHEATERPRQAPRPRARKPRPPRPRHPRAQAPRARPESRGGSLSWNFEEATPGSLPRGWHAATGEWKVVTDQTAPAGPKVLAQLAKSPDEAFNVVYVENTSLRDVRLSVRFRAVSGKVDQGGGLVWRLTDAKNYYIARYNPLEDNFRVYKVVAGHRKMLQGARLKVDHKAWHHLEVTMTGDHIQCALDGKKYLDVRDATFRSAGAVGLWTKSDAQTHFDAFTAGPVAVPPPAPVSRPGSSGNAQPHEQGK